MPTNCPAILQAYSLGCRDAQGGVKRFYITEHENIASYTEASGALTDLVLNDGKKFWLYEQELEIANAQEVITPSRQNGTTFVEQTFNATLHKRSASVAYSLRAIAHQNVVVIAEEMTGTLFCYGLDNGLSLDPSTSMTGTAIGDKNGYDLVFKGKESILAPTVSTALLATLIV